MKTQTTGNPVTGQKSHSADTLRWHPAFVQAIQLELFDWKDILEFTHEFQLTSEPLRIDLLIVKKKKDILIDKNIARIFRTHNILEYKSPGDYLSVKDFLKVYAYAHLYTAINPAVELSELTLTFIASRYPRKLLWYLTDVRGYQAMETAPGIYLVSGDYIPMQIIETKKLPEKENLWLASLRDNLKIKAAGVILEEGKKPGRESLLDAYLDVILRANPEIFMEARAMANRRNRPTFEEVFTKAGIIPEWIERGKREGEREGLERGLELGERKGLEQGKQEIAKSLLDRGWSVEDTAEITKLPAEKIFALVAT